MGPSVLWPGLLRFLNLSDPPGLVEARIALQTGKAGSAIDKVLLERQAPGQIVKDSIL